MRAMAQAQDTDSEDRPRWILAIILTIIGILTLAIASLMHSAYWQAVLINLGTTLFLFAGLALLERRLVRQIRALKIDALWVAQQEFGEALSTQVSLSHDVTRRSAVEESVRAIGGAIKAVGLVQIPSADDDGGVMCFGDIVGNNLRWEIGCGPRLFHRVTLKGGLVAEWPEMPMAGVHLDNEQPSEEEKRVLADFEAQVPILMRAISKRLRSGGAR
jgi:hypothetical protein